MAMRPLTPRMNRAARRERTRQSLSAAAEQLDDRLNKSGGAGGQVGEPWQQEIWQLYDTVPELRTAARITARAMSQCRLVLARVNENGEPAPLANDEDHPAKKMLAQLAGGEHGQTELLDAIGVALTAPGEVILVGALDQVGRDVTDDFTRMQAYSTSQVRQSSGNVIVKIDDSSQADRTLGGVRDPETGQLRPDGVAAIRVWRPHPQFSWKADSAARSALSVLREIAGYDDHVKAALFSRLAGAGILKIPHGLDLPGVEAEDDSDVDGSADPFLLYMMEIMSLAMKERDSAAALVPIFVRGEAEDLSALEHLSFSTPFDEKVGELRDKAVKRLSVAVDMPPEILLGLGDTQHWSGALINEDYKGGYLAELMGIACGALTSGWLYPALIANGLGDLPSDVIIWYDDSSVRTRENTGPEAQAAYDRGEISGDAYRRILGFDESDKPDADEFVAQVIKTILLKAPASLSPLLLPKMGAEFTSEQLDLTARITAATAVPTGDEEQSDGEGQTGQGRIPAESGAQAEPDPDLTPATPAALRAFRTAQRGQPTVN